MPDGEWDGHVRDYKICFLQNCTDPRVLETNKTSEELKMAILTCKLSNNREVTAQDLRHAGAGGPLLWGSPLPGEIGTPGGLTVVRR